MNKKFVRTFTTGTRFSFSGGVRSLRPLLSELGASFESTYKVYIKENLSFEKGEVSHTKRIGMEVKLHGYKERKIGID